MFEKTGNFRQQMVTDAPGAYQTTAYNPGIAEGIGPGLRPERDLGAIVIAVQGLEEQLAHSEEALTALEGRLQVLRRSVPEGVEKNVNQATPSNSTFANGLTEYVVRLAAINVRLRALDRSIDL